MQWVLLCLRNKIIFSTLSESEYYRERDEAFYRAYREALSRRDVRTHEDALRAALHSHTSQHWIPPFQAYRRILSCRKGVYPKSERKRRLAESLYREYLQVCQVWYFKDCSTYFKAQFAVGRPADGFYISMRTARRIIERKRHEKTR